MRYALPRDFEQLAARIGAVADKMHAEAGEPVLCHNDFYGPNFLVKGDEMRLIDWEYAAMGDPTCDLGNFVAQGSGYTVEETLGILPLYYGREATLQEQRHCLAAVSVVGWYWYVWAMYKEAMGAPVGEWLYIWYRAAKQFAAAAEELYGEAEKELMQVDAIESDEYFQKRSLKGGAVGWVLFLVSLGVAYTVSGDFSGWNYGMEHGGWLGLAIAWLIMGIMYLCTVFGLAELSSAIPAAGAGYGFARSAMGRTAGFATGLALVIEYVCAPAAISTFIANYILALGLLPEGTPPFAIVVAVYALFTAIHAIGVGEALKFMFVVSVDSRRGGVGGVCRGHRSSLRYGQSLQHAGRRIVRLERSVAYGHCRRHRFAAVRHWFF